MKTTDERFEEKYLINSGGCWEWLASKNGKGYGFFRVSGVLIRAHRFAWERVNGPVPENMFVCHKCDNPSCVNPGHLFLGTPKDNMVDKVAKGRLFVWSGERHGRAKLTWNQVNEIRASVDKSNRDLARIYGVSDGNIGYIRLNKSWIADRQWRST